MKGVVLAAMLALSPVSAAALSCMPHSVEAAFGQAQAAQEQFVVVQGRLEIDQKQTVKKRKKYDPKPATVVIDAQLTGQALSQSGFSVPYAKPVRVVLECFGPWCGKVQSGGQVLAFVETSGRSRVISVNPCGGFLFHNPTKKMLSKIKQCFAGKRCDVPR